MAFSAHSTSNLLSSTPSRLSQSSPAPPSSLSLSASSSSPPLPHSPSSSSSSSIPPSRSPLAATAPIPSSSSSHQLRFSHTRGPSSSSAILPSPSSASSSPFLRSSESSASRLASSPSSLAALAALSAPSSSSSPPLPTLSAAPSAAILSRPASTIMADSTLAKSQLGIYDGALEQKRQEHELMRLEHIRRFEHEMHLLAEQQRKDEQMLLQMAAVSSAEQDTTNGANTATTISEPNTPPDFRDAIPTPGATSMPGDRIRSNTVPVGVFVTPNGPSRLSGQQLMTPPDDVLPRTRTLTSTSIGPSRRLSNDDPMMYSAQLSQADVDSASFGLGQINTAKFLFGDDSSSSPSVSVASSSAGLNALKFNTTDDKFPILIRRESLNQQPQQQPQQSPLQSMQPTQSHRQPAHHQLPQQHQHAHPAAANQQWSFSNRNRGAHHQSLSGIQYDPSADKPDDVWAKQRYSESASHSRQPSQRSLSDYERREPAFPQSISPLPTAFGGQSAQAGGALEAHPSGPAASSYTYGAPPMSHHQPPVFHPQQQQHGFSYPPHPPHLYGNAHALENMYPSGPSPVHGHHHSQSRSGPGRVVPPQPSQQQQPHHQQPPLPHQPHPQHGQHHMMHRAQSSSVSLPSAAAVSAVAAGNRRQSDQDVNRFANVMLESLVNEIYSLCKDQHGCRYLQKKLEERNPTYLNMIFNETYPHVVELMIDPFGNYLCQKLLEHANDEQRTVLVETAAPQLVKIALNQHGTRALQKMIEHVSTPEQVRLIVNALKTNVVELIQDLNGNHVIQKCLNRLSTEDAQFIFDAVSENCVAVGTHRHGCCVLQRCIDHASEAQKKQLVNEITVNAFTLVQDPFGNYVTQYVLDLCDSTYSDPLIRRFAGNVCTLSAQKFSSNVIEKCIRIAEPSTRKILIEELLSSVFLEKLLRDSYANYVIQTALDYADAPTRVALVDVIRPILPSIRNTPYGRRIQSKIVGSAGNSAAPSSANSPQQTYQQAGFRSSTATPQQSSQPQQQGQQEQQQQQSQRGSSSGSAANANTLARRMQGLDLQDEYESTQSASSGGHTRQQTHPTHGSPSMTMSGLHERQYSTGSQFGRSAAASPFGGSEFAGYAPQM